MSIYLGGAVPNPNLVLTPYVVDHKFWAISLAIEVILCVLVIFLTIHTFCRTCLNLRDPTHYRGKTYLRIQRQIRANQVNFGDDSTIIEDEEPEESQWRQMSFLSIERRYLTNLPYFIFGIICINSFTSLTLQIILWASAFVTFFIINILLHRCMPRILKIAFIFVCLATPIPFYTSQHKFGNY